jgi:hypothetical protein
MEVRPSRLMICPPSALRRAAASAVERGNLKDLQEAMKGDAVVVQQLVAQSGSGADVNVGAPAATRRASGAVLEVSRKIVRYNAALEAMGLREHARRYYQEGENAEAEGKSAFVGTLLSGGAKMIGMGGKLAADSVGSELPTPDQQYRDDTLRLAALMAVPEINAPDRGGRRPQPAMPTAVPRRSSASWAVRRVGRGL